MARPRTGQILKTAGGWQVRLTFTDVNGKRRDLRHKVATRDAASRVLRDLQSKAATVALGSAAIEGDRLTVNKLAEIYERTHLKPAKYVDGRKVSGLRSVDESKRLLKIIKEALGRRLVASLGYRDLVAFRAKRFETEKRYGGQRSIATVNRELQALRGLLNFAVQEGWLARSPFRAGKPLISLADERRRQRVLTAEEESQLLAACVGRCAHLRPVLICAIDTGMRLGEILKLEWCDVELETGSIHVRAFNTKTMRSRELRATSRLRAELERLWESSLQRPDDLVFGIRNNVKSSFHSVREDVGLLDVRFHDLRHTNATRLAAVLDLAQVGNLLGHSRHETTLRYVNPHADVAQRAADALDRLRAGAEVESKGSSEMVN